MVFYNNTISLPIFSLFALLNLEFDRAFDCECWQSNSFIIVFILSGIMGLLISITTFLTMNVAGPTSFAIVGALNKIPLTILGFLIFSAPIDLKNGICVSIGILAGIIYSKAKYDES
jgi:GDP-mannose transporter